MDKYIDDLLVILGERRAALADALPKRVGAVADFRTRREVAVRTYVISLVPDLGDRTIRTLRDLFPDLKIRTESSWVFFRKLHRSVTVPLLRIQVRGQLDQGTTTAEWRRIIGPLDTKIVEATEAERNTRTELASVNDQIDALTKLRAVDKSKMDPSRREMYEHALKTQIAHPETIGRASRENTAALHPAYQTSPRPDSDTDILMMWLWYNVFFTNNDATYDADDYSADTSSPQNAATGTQDGLEHHEALGSQTYS